MGVALRAGCLALLCAPLWVGSAWAKRGCNVTESTEENRDGSTLVLRESLCENRGVREFDVLVRDVNGGEPRSLLEVVQQLAEAPNGSASFLDLDADGVFEVQITGSCGAGPNCEATIYKLAADGATMQPFFRGGYAMVRILDGYLVEGGRASCCAWEFHAYRVEPVATEIDPESYELRIDVSAEGGDDGSEPDVRCGFYRRRGEEWQLVEPPAKAWLEFCEQYGEKYEVEGE